MKRRVLLNEPVFDVAGDDGAGQVGPDLRRGELSLWRLFDLVLLNAQMELRAR
jgi:hypothetical protein